MEHRQRLCRPTTSTATVETSSKNKSTIVKSLSKQARGYRMRHGATAGGGGVDWTMESLLRSLALLMAFSLLIGNLWSWLPETPSKPSSSSSSLSSLDELEKDVTAFVPAESPTIEHNDIAPQRNDFSDSDTAAAAAAAAAQTEQEIIYLQEMEISAHLLEDKLLELIQDALSTLDTQTILALSQIYFTDEDMDNDEDGVAGLVSAAYRGTSIFYDETTSQGKAFHWLLKHDTYLLDYHKTYLSTLFGGMGGGGTRGATTSPPAAEFINYPTLLQRYILVVFFFATKGQINVEYDGSEASSMPSRNVPLTWTAHGSLHFLDNLHECQWYDSWHGTWLGVKACSHTSSTMTSYWNWSQTAATQKEELGEELGKSQVTQLFLPELGLEGSVPLELGLLTKLQTLDLQSNYLGGDIPVSVGSLTDLRSLSLGHNNFVGTLPENISQLSNLEKFLINFNNMRGTDVIPASFCDLTVTGKLFNLWTDCNRRLGPVLCECCTVCCDSLDSCIPKEEMGDSSKDDGESTTSHEKNETSEDDSIINYYKEANDGETNGNSLHRNKRIHHRSAGKDY